MEFLMNQKDIIEKIGVLELFFKQEYEQNRSYTIESISPYSKEINQYIRTAQELNIYKKCNLVEDIITRRALIFPIDKDYKFGGGITNLERMLKGEAPRDSATGEIIELHHIGQKFDSPFAELPRSIHCSTATYSILHDTTIESWRIDKQLISLTQQEIYNYWQMRGEILAGKR